MQQHQSSAFASLIPSGRQGIPLPRRELGLWRGAFPSARCSLRRRQDLCFAALGRHLLLRQRLLRHHRHSQLHGGGTRLSYPLKKSRSKSWGKANHSQEANSDALDKLARRRKHPRICRSAAQKAPWIAAAAPNLYLPLVTFKPPLALQKNTLDPAFNLTQGRPDGKANFLIHGSDGGSDSDPWNSSPAANFRHPDR